MTRRRSSTDKEDNDKEENDYDNDEDDDDLIMSNSNNHNKNNKNSLNKDIKYDYNYNAKTNDPNGENTLDRIAQFEAMDDENGDNKQEMIERDPKYQYKNYNDYKQHREYKEKQQHKASIKRGGGASHKDVSNENWYKNPKDFNGNKKGDTNYNPQQLLIPSRAYNRMTPSQAQFWQTKSNYFDGILFFKVGKFYELYYMDADIGHKLAGLSYMGGETPHVGFPEKSFEKYAKIFVSYGYRVYRVEQMETVQQQKKRKAKVVDRKICEVLTSGTLVDGDFLESVEANYVLSIVEKQTNKTTATIDVGICYMDFSTGQSYLGRFTDDRNRSRLRTLIVQIDPKQIVYKKNKLSQQTLSLIKMEAKYAVHHALFEDDQFYSSEQCKNILKEEKYWKNGFNSYPLALQKAWTHQLTMNAFGGILYELQHSIHDHEILPHSEWSIYDPLSRKCNDYLTLDGSTLANLEILKNNEGTRKGTLISFVDHCCTKWGHRMMEKWITLPLNNFEKINERLDAVEYLINDNHWYDIIDIKSQFDKLPDLERILHHLAVLGTKGRMMDKAILFEKCWDKNKIQKLIKALDGFQALDDILNQIDLHRINIKSKLINDITSIVDNYDNKDNDDDNDDEMKNNYNPRNIPAFGAWLNKFRNSFDEEFAKKEGQIKPTPGEDAPYDKIRQDLINNRRDLEKILQEIQTEHGSTKIRWYHSKGKIDKKYQIEVPKVLRFVPPDDWHHESNTKSVDRYHTDEIKDLLKTQEVLVNEEEILLRDAARRTFARFAENGNVWKKVVKNIGTLDCLLSLAHTSKYCITSSMTRPQFIKQKNPKTDKSFLEIRECRHPCIDDQQLNAVGQQGAASQFIPNDTILGCKENKANFVIVTGPNMGGKSTLLRQTCIAVILAHIGCYVPCKSMILTPVDRIFTRVGANDRILAGQSTFMVELEETSNILSHATNNSLVILDELGRGTSTFDGTSIAWAVAKTLIEEIKCRTLFSTHYHGLTDSFINNKDVAMYHMAYRQINDDITFLYKFTKGICDQSHGINCAKLAGLPQDLLDKAQQESKKLHDAMHNVKQHGTEEMQKVDLDQLVKNFQNLIKDISQEKLWENIQNNNVQKKNVNNNNGNISG